MISRFTRGDTESTLQTTEHLVRLLDHDELAQEEEEKSYTSGDIRVLQQSFVSKESYSDISEDEENPPEKSVINHEVNVHHFVHTQNHGDVEYIGGEDDNSSEPYKGPSLRNILECTCGFCILCLCCVGIAYFIWIVVILTT